MEYEARRTSLHRNTVSIVLRKLKTEFLFFAVYPAYCFLCRESDNAVILIVRAGRIIMYKNIFPELMEESTVCNGFSNSCKRYTVCFMHERDSLCLNL